MFSSRTLTDRNNDPRPYLVHTTAGTEFRSHWLLGNEDAEKLPRPAYQYGTLPENPILVEFRRVQGDHTAWSRAEDWAFYGLVGNWPFAESLGATREQFVQATRVLRLLPLLAAVTR